ncbi:MAG: DegT/DnrJ/EryC1/StrS family aminotransferase [Clostridiales Family XIII bacterium]|jgi:dTDP-4-amino-4,6-dideoxygalactose transaminase|nr:DegT/DnrJ/EryC1/StrS family aminotransferase [Clostridiales Family XIII bacterium]
MKEIPLSVPNLNIEIAANLRECVETGWISTGGRFITEFEEKVAAYTGAGEAVGCQSGTAGLHTALRILGVKAGDIVVCPTLTFIAAVNPVRYLGAEPVFIDCAADLCMDPEKLERYLSADCRREGELLVDNATSQAVTAIVVVHVFGVIANMERIMDIASEYGLPVLEDATEAMGSFMRAGRYKGKHAGAIGDIGVFSFNANKIITTGGGGMIVEGGGSGPGEDVPGRAKAYVGKARYLTTTAKDDGLYFAHNEVGYNYRMLNLQAALGVSQIDELDRFIEVKKRNYDLYSQMLAGTPGIRLMPPPKGQRWNYWFYSLYVDDEPAHMTEVSVSPADRQTALGDSPPTDSRRDRLMNALIADGIQCRPVWKLVHTQKPYKGFRARDIERAKDYEKHILNLPCSTNLTEDEVRYVCRKIIENISTEDSNAMSQTERLRVTAAFRL